MVMAQPTSTEEWQRLASEVFVPLRVTGDAPQPRIRFDYESVADVTYSRVRSTRGEVIRAEELIDSADSGIALFSLQLRGIGRVTQRGRTAVAHSASGVLYVADAPYRLDFPEDTDILVVKAPFSSLGLSADRLRDAVAAPLRGDRTLGLLARLLGSSLAGRGLLPSPAETARVSLELMREAFARQSGVAMRPRARTHAAVRAEARDRIRSHIDDANLRVGTLAGATGVSERTIHTAFAEVGSSPAAEIRRARLDVSRSLLETTSMSVVEIALACGFTDPTSFTRAFQRQWHCSPTAHRALVRDGWP
jgi:AraC-like DNA-binding protein